MNGPRQFNIHDGQGRILCPACGYPDYSPADAYFDHGGERMTICPCCLWEPGFDDEASNSPSTILNYLRNYRDEWLQLEQWRGVDPPPDWNARAQLASLFSIAPHVR